MPFYDIKINISNVEKCKRKCRKIFQNFKMLKVRCIVYFYCSIARPYPSSRSDKDIRLKINSIVVKINV